ncbi:hypothetical protein K443DRAFT_670662 [Laccaria amethystina LaAM-08-1]|uniref:Uncharacterized protein n=1 Tax=Laccaria amethystina LaAM-08-1 TaxID=1095629 RepID=A0A0C9XCS2_9AGAR|nr:hypothetical protein K443DRAFT_670662 [Laccaria amethystina LaAM-08-1]
MYLPRATREIPSISHIYATCFITRGRRHQCGAYGVCHIAPDDIGKTSVTSKLYRTDPDSNKRNSTPKYLPVKLQGNLYWWLRPWTDEIAEILSQLLRIVDFKTQSHRGVC